MEEARFGPIKGPMSFTESGVSTLQFLEVFVHRQGPLKGPTHLLVPATHTLFGAHLPCQRPTLAPELPGATQRQGRWVGQHRDAGQSGY
jgi:hypothetical protein